MHQTARTLEIEQAAPAALEATAARPVDGKVINLSPARWVPRVEQSTSFERDHHSKHLVVLLFSHSLT